MARGFRKEINSMRDDIDIILMISIFLHIEKVQNMQVTFKSIIYNIKHPFSLTLKMSQHTNRSILDGNNQ